MTQVQADEARRVELIVAVERGARWLDEHDPNWFERLDLERLDMHDCDRCVVGQLTGGPERAAFVGWHDRLRELNPDATPARLQLWSLAHGFALPNWPLLPPDYDYAAAWWRFLRGLWVDQVSQRVAS